jgi:hypothetical protein
MDVEQFDRIAKGLGSGASRRRLLRLGSALLPVGLLAAWPREAAGAEQRNRRQRNRRQWDADGDGLGAATERRLGTAVRNPDTDGDGLTDGAEFTHHGTDPLLGDTDRDGLGDADEIHIVTNPLDSDTDDDGLPDGQEAIVVRLIDPREKACRDLCFVQLNGCCGGAKNCPNVCVRQMRACASLCIS